MITIQESGMTFGHFDEKDIYKIENSAGHQGLGDGFKIVEFTYLRSNVLFFIEAKSSIPKPESTSDYEAFWQEILEKFENALLLELMGCLRRNQQVYNELADNHKNIDWEKVDIRIILVIRPVPKEYLVSITDVFRKRLKKILKLWSIKYANIFVINEEQAIQQNLAV
jgi:hypothetical protein